MRVAVTGATGFLGRYVVRQLADAGHRHFQDLIDAHRRAKQEVAGTIRGLAWDRKPIVRTKRTGRLKGYRPHGVIHSC